MKTSIAFLIAAGSASAFAPSESSSRPSVTTLSETKESLVELAVKLNPIVKFYDP
jgi:hypothetical protein